MSTTILDIPNFAIARCASLCDRCVDVRGECVQFSIGRRGEHTYTLCSTCWAELNLAVLERREFQP